MEEDGYSATRHQREVGAGYFDAVARAVSGGESSTLALEGSTEEAQFASKGGGMTIAVELTREVDGPEVLAALSPVGSEASSPRAAAA